MSIATPTIGPRSVWVRLATIATCVAAVAFCVTTGKAQANAPIGSFSTEPLSTQAGGHGDLLIHFGFHPELDPELPCQCNMPKDVTINTPAGVFGIPSNVTHCTTAQFSTGECPVESQVGVAYIQAGFPATLAIFNMVPRSDQAALLAVETPFLGARPIYTSFTIRTENDYGLEAKTFGITRIVALQRADFLFWGVPGDPIHDALRFPADGWGASTFDFMAHDRGQFLCFNRVTTPQLVQGINPLRSPDGLCSDTGNGDPPSTPYNTTTQPFLTNPTDCIGPLQSSMDVLAYDLGSDHAVAPFSAITGCDQLSFSPSLAAKPTTTEADSPSGIDVDLKVPVPASPNAPTPSQIHQVAVTLPEGFAVDSNAADGKVACTDVEAKFGTRDQAQCPENSKIGTLEIHSSALPGTLPGAVYLGEPLPGNRYRIFLTADGFSLHIKLKGYAVPDPKTGQLTVHFDELPEAPFQEFNFHIFGGERGLLTTPTQCGTYPVKTDFVPWDSELPNQTSTQFFTIDSGPGGTPCPPSSRPFAPGFQAGVTDNTGGVHSPFSLQLTREDGTQNLSGLDVTTPPGFSATLKGIPYCPESAISRLADTSYSGLAEQVSPACPAASQVGTAVASAGAGSKPLHVAGKVYLAGPYKGAPLSLEVVIPAISGPYDLGNVAVRAALNVDPITAQVSAVSDPLPQIIEGIPLRTRSILVSLDRKDFALNPTNCDPFEVNATAFGDQGASASLKSHFQVANCADLGFGPKLSLKLSGGTKRNGHPALHATFSPVAGDANTKRVSVTLPSTEQIDQARIGSSCTRAQFAANSCPDNSILGQATATSPLLDNPLKGTVYLVSAGNRLPDLVMALRGQFSIDLHGVIDTAKSGGLRTTFQVVPDVPVSGFTLNLLGAGKGLIVNNTDICAHNRPAMARIDGQNGRSADQRVALHPSCGKARHKRHLHRAGKAA